MAEEMRRTTEASEDTMFEEPASGTAQQILSIY